MIARKGFPEPVGDQRETRNIALHHRTRQAGALTELANRGDPVDASRAMSSAFDDCLRARGTILRSHSPGLFDAALPNGKVVIAHLSKELAAAPPDVPEGASVLLELSPFDLDRARIAEMFPS